MSGKSFPGRKSERIDDLLMERSVATLIAYSLARSLAHPLTPSHVLSLNVVSREFGHQGTCSPSEVTSMRAHAPDIRCIARIAEDIEARAQQQIWQSMPEELASQLDAHCDHHGSALLTIMGKSASKSANRVTCLGLMANAKEAMVDEIIGRYRDAQAHRFSLHLSPAARPKAISRWLEDRGFIQSGQYAIFVRRTDAPPTQDTRLSVRKIGKRHAVAFAEIVCETFGWSDNRVPWLAATVGRPGFHHYVAFDRDCPVATGMLYVEGDKGWMGLGATLTPYRRQGAQRIIIAARIKQAAADGCEWVTAETLAPEPGRPQGSYRNLIHSGFEMAYLRPIYVWDDRVRG